MFHPPDNCRDHFSQPALSSTLIWFYICFSCQHIYVHISLENLMTAAYKLTHNTQLLDILHIHEKDIKLLEINPNEFFVLCFPQIPTSQMWCHAFWFLYYLIPRKISIPSIIRHFYRYMWLIASGKRKTKLLLSLYQIHLENKTGIKLMIGNCFSIFQFQWDNLPIFGMKSTGQVSEWSK